MSTTQSISSSPSVLGALPPTLGVLVLLLGAAKAIAGLVLSVQLMVEDVTEGGLFGFHVGPLLVFLLGMPLFASGVLDLVAGWGMLRRRTWGNIAVIVSGVAWGAGCLIVNQVMGAPLGGPILLASIIHGVLALGAVGMLLSRR